MGVMIDGSYHVNDPAPDSYEGGEFKRATSTIRNWITTDGPFPPDSGRYHLFVAWNCPWAHRALLARAILQLEDQISVSYARPRRTDQGWVFDTDGAYADTELGMTAIHQVYALQNPGYTGRLTVPVLWDRQTGQIVSNESADILRMFGAFGDPDLYPNALHSSIDDWNTRIYDTVNNGVYKSGFATTQDAYEEIGRAHV